MSMARPCLCGYRRATVSQRCVVFIVYLNVKYPRPLKAGKNCEGMGYQME